MRVTFITAVLVAMLTATAAAQDPLPEELPIGIFAADVRAAMPRFKDDPSIASAVGVTTDNLPTRGVGLVFGAHIYPFRLGGVTVGFGGEVLASGADRTLDPTAEDAPPGPTVNTRFSSISPQLSLNFGRRRGWSYVSGGIGWSRFTVEQDTSPIEDGDRVSTINYGGGARWFPKEHVAVCFDVRFYSIGAQTATTARPAYPKMRLLVLSAGVALK